MPDVAEQPVKRAGTLDAKSCQPSKSGLFGSRRRWLFIGALVVLVAASCWLLTRFAFGNRSTGGFATPEACFEAMQVAAEAGDDARLAGCLGPAEQDRALDACAYSLLFGKMITDVDKRGTPAHLQVVLDKYGLIPPTQISGSDEKTLGDPEVRRKIGLNGIRDKTAFIVDSWRALDQCRGIRHQQPPAISLQGLVVTDNEALASVVTVIDGKEEKRPVKFVRTHRTWLGGEGASAAAWIMRRPSTLPTGASRGEPSGR